MSNKVHKLTYKKQKEICSCPCPHTTRITNTTLSFLHLLSSLLDYFSLISIFLHTHTHFSLISIFLHTHASIFLPYLYNQHNTLFSSPFVFFIGLFLYYLYFRPHTHFSVISIFLHTHTSSHFVFFQVSTPLSLSFSNSMFHILHA